MSIKTESVAGGLVRTYSDAGKYITQAGTGIEYVDAVDPIGLNRKYAEGRVIPTEHAQ